MHIERKKGVFPVKEFLERHLLLAPRKREAIISEIFDIHTTPFLPANVQKTQFIAQSGLHFISFFADQKQSFPDTGTFALACDTAFLALPPARKAPPQGIELVLRHEPVAGLSQHVAQNSGKAFTYAVGRGLCRARLRG